MICPAKHNRIRLYLSKIMIMAPLESIRLPHLPAELPVFVALYRNVENAEFLRQQLLAGNTEYEYALIDASMVCKDTYRMKNLWH